MNEIIIKALYNRIKAGQITIDQLPDTIKPQIAALQQDENGQPFKEKAEDEENEN